MTRTLDTPTATSVGTLVRKRFGAPSGQLKVGVLLASRSTLDRWAHAVLQSLARETSIDLCVLRPVEHGPDQRVDGLPWLLEKLRVRGGSEADPFAALPLPDIPGVPTVDVPDGGSLSQATRAAVRARALDVLVWLDAEPPAGDCSDLARLGVWAFRFGDPARPRVRPYYWREIAEHEAISVIALERHTASFDEAQTIAEDATTTQTSWYFGRNATHVTSLAAGMLTNALIDAAVDEPRFLRRLGPSRRSPAPARTASAAQAAAFVADRLAHSVRARLLGNEDAGLEYWFVAIRRRTDRDGHDVAGNAYVRVPLPQGVQYADPFLHESGGRHWLFVEEIPTFGAKAHLTCMEVRGDLTVGEPVVVLKKPYHLSYPCVFEHEGEHFMIPESGEDGTVQLYRATRFPHEWELDTVLIEGLPMRDTTPVLHDGVWYFFTTVHEDAPETFLFTADRLRGPWRYHPANPVCSDARRARGAGHVFERDGKLVRPSQDCAVRYGYATVLNEITCLTPTEYAERPIETILPVWRPGIRGTHTVNRDAAYEVIDGSEPARART